MKRPLVTHFQLIFYSLLAGCCWPLLHFTKNSSRGCLSTELWELWGVHLEYLNRWNNFHKPCGFLQWVQMSFKGTWRGNEAVACSRKEVSRPQPETTSWPGRNISVEYLKFSFLTLFSNPVKSIIILEALHACKFGAQKIEDFGLCFWAGLVHSEKLPTLRLSR